jgi:hypothetical protein
MQAITTKFLSATNTRGSRIKATCDAGSVTISYPYELDYPDTHRKAAQALVDKLGWNTDSYGNLIVGGLPNNAGCVFVFNSGFAY